MPKKMTREEIIHKITDSAGIVPLIEIVSDNELLEMQIWAKQNSRMIENGIEIQRRVAQNGGANNLAELQAKNSFAGLYLRIVNDEVEKRKMKPKTITNIDKSGNTGIIQEGDGNTATQNFNHFNNLPKVEKKKSTISKIWNLISKNPLISGLILLGIPLLVRWFFKNWNILIK